MEQREMPFAIGRVSNQKVYRETEELKEETSTTEALLK